MINLTIAKMEQEHVDVVAELEKTCFSTPWTVENLKDALENETSYFFVALNDDKVIGYVGVSVISDSCFINNIAVFPEYRKQGVGKALMKIAILTADAMGTGFISLEVRESNYAAINLYRKLGFEVMGLRKDFYRLPREHALIMTKNF
ncbi:MAG: ribosomal protein S18-alanine N-acetyltransferase [Clostridia bacterium]|nr:ribosomal protein S18-alanine N-acetyltransferase [Clostridia bacterium]